MSKNEKKVLKSFEELKETLTPKEIRISNQLEKEKFKRSNKEEVEVIDIVSNCYSKEMIEGLELAKEMEASGKYKQLSEESTKLLVSLLFIELEGNEEKLKQIEEDSESLSFLSKIVKVRIEGLNLPIKFTTLALIAVNCFCDRAGAAVLLLIDALNKFDGQTVTVQKLCELYPVGFYNEKTFLDIIDKQIKTKKLKWSDIY